MKKKPINDTSLSGIASLIEDIDRDITNTSDLRHIPVENIEPMINQPRTNMDPIKMKELERSVQRNGVLQPILVTEVEQNQNTENKRYRLIAGERRWRASIKLGLPNIPARIVYVDTKTQYEFSLIENTIRDDLTPSEQAKGFKILIDSGWSQGDIAERIGKDRTYVNRILKILTFNQEVQNLIDQGKLSPGHIRSIPHAGDIDGNTLAKKAAQQQLSVKQIEDIVSKERNKIKNNIQKLKADDTEHQEIQKITEQIKKSWHNSKHDVDVKISHSNTKNEKPWKCSLSFDNQNTMIAVMKNLASLGKKIPEA